jgi:hypothetical protein
VNAISSPVARAGSVANVTADGFLNCCCVGIPQVFHLIPAITIPGPPIAPSPFDRSGGTRDVDTIGIE